MPARAESLRLCAERGYAMAGLLVAIAVMGILMSAALPVWRTYMQREKEAELLFRGEQYVRAIDLYQRRFPGAYPTDLEALVEGRFLRRLYLDPMTGEPFRVLTQGSAATALGDAAAGADSETADPAGFGGRAAGGPDGGRFSDRLGRASTGLGRASSGSTSRGFGRSSTGSTTTGMGRSSSGSTGRGIGRASTGRLGRTSGSTGNGFGRRSDTAGPGRLSRAAGDTDDELGGIVGVVSRSSAASLREYNGAARYDQWLFVHAPQAAAPGAAGMPGAGGGVEVGREGRVGLAPRPARGLRDGAGRNRGRRSAARPLAVANRFHATSESGLPTGGYSDRREVCSRSCQPAIRPSKVASRRSMSVTVWARPVTVRARSSIRAVSMPLVALIRVSVCRQSRTTTAITMADESSSVQDIVSC